MAETKRHKVFISFQHSGEDTIPEKSYFFTFFSTYNALSNSFYNLLTSLVRRTKSNEYERPYQLKYRQAKHSE